MDWNNALTSKLVKRVLCGCGILMMAPLLSACNMLDLQSEQRFRSSFDTSSAMPAGTASVQQGLPMENFYPENEKKDADRAKVALGLNQAEAKALGCSMGDRFDRKAAFAYNFSDQQTRIALNMGIDGPSFSNPGRFEVNKVMFRYTHNFQPPAPSQKGSKCLYPSGFQGIFGSVYHEFFVRENYTIWHELRDKGINFH